MIEITKSNLSEEKKVYPSKGFSEHAHVRSLEEYEKIYKRSVKDPEGFWSEKAEQLHWFKKWDRVFRYETPPFVKWFEGGKINVSYNCLDRHLNSWRRNKAAIIWQGEPEEDSETYTYSELHREVCKFANVLKKYGVMKGDRVSIYMPMVPSLPIAMLACTRIGAIHSIVFGGFSSKALMNRINDCEAKILITSDGGFRRGKVIPLKDFADEALKGCKTVKKVIVYKRTKNKIKMKKGRDLWWHDEMKNIKAECEAEQMDAEDPLFILYTSGTTGTPKGVLHTTGGYLVYTYQTFKWIFDAKVTDTFWCTADIGWITGHSYIAYGPLANGITTVMFEGVPDYPEPDRFWEIIEKYKVTIFYTAPTAIRAVERYGDKWPRSRNLSSLRLLGSVGEPIGPETWLWYYNVIGNGKCPIVDTWWQTETGGILISSLPGAIPMKPGSATKPFPGIVAAILREDGKEAGVDEDGYLVVMKPWPSIERTIWGNPERYNEVYFSKFPGIYLTGDQAKVDKEGYFWIMGRLDDVVNISGHRIGTAEVEAALVENKSVAEAAIVGVHHEIKGQGLYAFVTLKKGVNKSDDIKKELLSTVKKEIGSIA
ncbi:MAG: acetate--CoA ligase, partial [Actinomycetia bacterium]|nr:acetate--CoA ligase [Actinomycetes bacterium]